MSKNATRDRRVAKEDILHRKVWCIDCHKDVAVWRLDLHLKGCLGKIPYKRQEKMKGYCSAHGITLDDLQHLLNEAGITFEQIGRSGYHLSRYRDQGPYKYPDGTLNARFLHGSENRKEMFDNLGPEWMEERKEKTRNGIEEYWKNPKYPRGTPRLDCPKCGLKDTNKFHVDRCNGIESKPCAICSAPIFKHEDRKNYNRNKYCSRKCYHESRGKRR